MIKALEKAIEKIKALPMERQEYAAAVLEEIAADDGTVYQLSEEEDRLLQEAIDELEGGQRATDAEVRAVYDKYRR
jgi:hypothetical protein